MPRVLPALVAVVLLGSFADAETLSGRIRDEQNRGVGNVAITLSGRTTRSATTHANGRFRLDDVAPGRYELTVASPPGTHALFPRLVEIPGPMPPVFVLSPDVTPISRVQGASHISPLNRKKVEVAGVVTALRGKRGFYLQDPVGDDIEATSEGLFVYTTRSQSVGPGDLVVAHGRVQEHYTGGQDSGDLSVTQLRLTEATVLAEDWRMVEPVILGQTGRVPPGRVLTDDATGNVEDSPFDPANDGLDFFESLEGMIVQVTQPVVVGSIHTAYGEFQVLADHGRHASTPTDRGGVILTEDDFNPEKITVDIKGDPDVTPQPYHGLVVGDRFAGPIVGPLDYNYSDYKILPWVTLPEVIPALLEREVARPVEGPHTLTCGAFNVENLSARSAPKKFADIANTIVHALHSPDILALSEIQDDSGGTDNGIVSAAETYDVLIQSIQDAGGPSTYTWVDIPPEDGQDGGAAGANIRVGFLYDRKRVELIARPVTDPRTPAGVKHLEGRPGLVPSPGLVSPTSGVFSNSRKPLAVEFLFRGHTLFFVANHFNSKGGDAQIFGRAHPLVFRSETRRVGQAKAVYELVRAIVDVDPEAAIVVLGDFNEFAWAPAMKTLKGDLLVDLAEELLPPQERYTYVYRGNSQDLDHILISRSLRVRTNPTVQIVHRYAEYLYGQRHSDHDPLLASLTFE